MTASEQQASTKKTSRSRANMYISGMILVLLSLNLLLAGKTRHKSKEIELLESQKQVTEATYEIAMEHYKTGLLAASIRNEYAGWKTSDTLPVQLLDYFGRETDRVKIDSLSLHRPLLFRPLPAASTNSTFNYCLAQSGQISLRLSDTGTGKSKYDLPIILDQARNRFDLPFSLQIPETESSDKLITGHWHLNTKFNLTHLWEELPILPQNQQEIACDE